MREQDALTPAVQRAQETVDGYIGKALDKAAAEVGPERNISPDVFKLVAMIHWGAQLQELDPVAARLFFKSMAELCSPGLTIKEHKAVNRRRQHAVDKLKLASELAQRADTGETGGLEEHTEVRDVQRQEDGVAVGAVQQQREEAGE